MGETVGKYAQEKGERYTCTKNGSPITTFLGVGGRQPLEWMVRALRFLDMIGDRRRMKTQEGEAGR